MTSRESRRGLGNKPRPSHRGGDQEDPPLCRCKQRFSRKTPPSNHCPVDRVGSPLWDGPLACSGRRHSPEWAWQEVLCGHISSPLHFPRSIHPTVGRPNPRHYAEDQRRPCPIARATYLSSPALPNNSVEPLTGCHATAPPAAENGRLGCPPGWRRAGGTAANAGCRNGSGEATESEVSRSVAGTIVRNRHSRRGHDG